MFCGIGFFITWTYFVANFKESTFIASKNLLLIGGALFVLAIIELLWEIKKGFKIFWKIILKIFVFPFKKINTKRKIKKIQRKIELNKSLSKKELLFYKQNLGEI